jgi:pimeloyl-ACP methyl ester carboxylesterase
VLLSSIPRRRESKCRIFETQALHARARHWRDGSFGPIIGEHLRHVATNVRAVEITDSGHWVAEEQPDAVASALLEFLPPPE